ncbi:MAG TPA: hypothetical protein VM846_02745 [Vicinamibacterales bacterium]|jgi:hypothetical protein|nr:hypothetical protein [Vicinamibacterales bacterium]
MTILSEAGPGDGDGLGDGVGPGDGDGVGPGDGDGSGEVGEVLPHATANNRTARQTSKRE